jgi:hypothetical protein
MLLIPADDGVPPLRFPAQQPKLHQPIHLDLQRSFSHDPHVPGQCSRMQARVGVHHEMHHDPRPRFGTQKS